MPIKYKAVCYSKPGEKGGASYKWYPRIYKRQKITLEKLAQRISMKCSFHPADVHGVLTALCSEIPELLLDNNSIDLGGLGIFSLHSKGIPSDNEREVNHHKITDVKIAFRPGKDIKKAISLAQFRKGK